MFQNVDAGATVTPESSNATKSERANWGNDMEFLMSCIAMSVGLGNVWRFPFTALENGGGAFVIPYLIVLTLIGRPIYYMEMLIGQFSSRGSIKVYDMVPALRGTFTFYAFIWTMNASKNGISINELCRNFPFRCRIWTSDFDWCCCNVLRYDYGNYITLFLQFIQIDIAMDNLSGRMG